MIDIKQSMAQLLKDEFNIDPNVTALLFDKGVLFIPACRNVLINEEYRKRMQPKCKRQIKSEIAEKYCISLEMVEKITCKKITNFE